MDENLAIDLNYAFVHKGQEYFHESYGYWVPAVERTRIAILVNKARETTWLCERKKNGFLLKIFKKGQRDRKILCDDLVGVNDIIVFGPPKDRKKQSA